MNKKWIIGTLLVIVMGAYVGIRHYYPQKIKDDNVFEEFAEDVFKSEIGYDIDLTPSSKEEHE